MLAVFWLLVTSTINTDSTSVKSFSYFVSIWLSTSYQHCYTRSYDSWLGFKKCTIGSSISRVLDPINNLDHNPIFIKLNFSLKHHIVSKTFFVWDYNNGVFLDLNNALCVTLWEFIIMNSLNVNSALSNIKNVIKQTLKAFIPTKIVYPSNKSKPCFTRELRLLIPKRYRYYKRWLKAKNTNHKLLYNKTRNLVQRKIKLAKQKYNESFMSKLNVVNPSDLNY